MGDCFSHVSKTLLSHTLYKLKSRSKAINLLRFLNMCYTLFYLLIYLLIFFIYSCMYLFIYLVESSKVSKWKEKVSRLVLLFVKKKEMGYETRFRPRLNGEKLGSLYVSGKLPTYPPLSQH